MVIARESQALEDLIRVIRPNSAIEFGSWEGRSALNLMRTAASIDLDMQLVCVDTWLGSREHWADSFPNSEFSFEHLKLRNGEPQVLEIFKDAIKAHGFENKVSIVRAPTTVAVPYLIRTGLVAHLVYIDADHSFRSVLADLRSADSILGHEGAIAGDDWTWPSVRAAVGYFSWGRRTVLKSQDQQQYLVLHRTQREGIASFLRINWTVERFIFLGELPYILRLAARKRLLRPARKILDQIYLSLRLPGLKRSIVAGTSRATDS